jgi:hypothetical protein
VPLERSSKCFYSVLVNIFLGSGWPEFGYLLFDLSEEEV